MCGGRRAYRHSTNEHAAEPEAESDASKLHEFIALLLRDSQWARSGAVRHILVKTILITSKPQRSGNKARQSQRMGCG